ncbi:MAG: putative transport system ATP-binding protein [Patescibacteria group bacterium]|jgi:putative ABC transport system ATP-binding protein|nr:putative transport system ATP-binding protein [Patescibacteria group bacterium]
MNPIISVKNLVKSYKSGDSELVVLKNLELTVPRGQFLSIIGRSGSGKSTLLYQLGLLDHPNQGQIVIDSTDVTKLDHDSRTKFRLNQLGYVFQDYALIPELTTLEQVMLPLLMQGLKAKDAKDKAMKSLERIGLSDKLSNLPSQLSGGQQQRVSIARAIAHEPQIIFADEPTANLDTETSDSVLQAFLSLHKQGQTIIMVTHEPEYARLTDRTVVLSDGKILSDTTNTK